LVISLGSIFDSNPDALDLVRVLNALLNPENIEVFRSYHSTWPVPFDTDRGIRCLTQKARRFRRGKLRDAIQRIRDLRNQAIAHIDMEPVFENGRTKVWEIDYVLAGAAGAVVLANQFATGRFIDRAQMAAISRRNIAEFSRALLAGSKPAPVAGSQ